MRRVYVSVGGKTRDKAGERQGQKSREIAARMSNIEQARAAYA